MSETKDLTFFRKQLDVIDNEIVKLLSQRFVITRQVGEFKRKRNIPPLDQARENAIYEKLHQKAIEKNIDPEMLKNIWKVIMTQSKKEQ